MNNELEAVARAGDQQQPLLVSADDVAQMLDISPRTVWRLLSAGKLIEPVRVGGNTRWRVDELRRWIAEGCPPPNGAS
jgi:predicted DNA-binding transcriptional regulator AlpA